MTSTTQPDGKLRATLLGASTYPMIAVDGTGLVVAFNRAAEEFTGLSAEEAAGRPIWELQAGIAPAAMPYEIALERAQTSFGELVRLAVEDPVGWHRTFEVELLGRHGRLMSARSEVFPLVVDRRVMIVSMMLSPRLVDARAANARNAATAATAAVATETPLPALGAHATGLRRRQEDPTNRLDSVVGVVAEDECRLQSCIANAVGTVGHLLKPLVPSLTGRDHPLPRAAAGCLALTLVELLLGISTAVRAAGLREIAPLLIEASDAGTAGAFEIIVSAAVALEAIGPVESVDGVSIERVAADGGVRYIVRIAESLLATSLH